VVGRPYKGTPSLFTSPSAFWHLSVMRAAWNIRPQCMCTKFYLFYAEKSKLIPALCPEAFTRFFKYLFLRKQFSANVAVVRLENKGLRMITRKIISPTLTRNNIVLQCDDVSHSGKVCRRHLVSSLFLLISSQFSFVTRYCNWIWNTTGYIRAITYILSATIIANDLPFTSPWFIHRIHGERGLQKYAKVSEVPNKLFQ